MNNAKKDRRLKSLWYKKDLNGWVNFKFKIKRYPEKNIKLLTLSNSFQEDMLVWNNRFTHEETQLKQYKDWNPYCCNEHESCSSRAWDRMEKTENGWDCPFCGMSLGKHLARIPKHIKPYIIQDWNKYSGRPNIYNKQVLASTGATIKIPK